MSTCQFQGKDTAPCTNEAESVYRLICPNCTQHMVRAYCWYHEDLIKARILLNRMVRCTGCQVGKRSKETYTRLGAA